MRTSEFPNPFTDGQMFFCYSGLLLNSILTSFKHSFIANRAEKFVTILSNSITEGITKAQLFRSLGLCLSQCPPPSEQKSPVLTGSFTTISTFTHVAEYIACVEPWAQYTAMNFDVISEDFIAFRLLNLIFFFSYVK